MCEMKQDYTNAEWKQREEYYRKSLLALSIPELPTTKEVLVLTSALDTLMTEATFEGACIERIYEKASMDLKNAEAELFNILKQQKVVEGLKVTESEVKGLVKSHLKQNPIGGFSHDIFSILKVAMDRNTYMKAVIKAISEKKSSIISTLSVLKLEANVSPATKDVVLNEL